MTEAGGREIQKLNGAVESIENVEKKITNQGLVEKIIKGFSRKVRVFLMNVQP